MHRSLSAVTVVTSLLAAAPAQADDRGPDEETAVSLTVGASVLSLGALGGGILTENGPLAVGGFAGVLILPSLGHWYAGDYDTIGLGLRIGGLGLGALGAFIAANGFENTDNESATSDEDEEMQIVIGIGLFVGGWSAIVTGVVYDWVTVREVARKKRMTFAPMVAPGVAGLSVAGSF